MVCFCTRCAFPLALRHDGKVVEEARILTGWMFAAFPFATFSHVGKCNTLGMLARPSLATLLSVGGRGYFKSVQLDALPEKLTHTHTHTHTH